MKSFSTRIIMLGLALSLSLGARSVHAQVETHKIPSGDGQDIENLQKKVILEESPDRIEPKIIQQSGNNAEQILKIPNEAALQIDTPRIRPPHVKIPKEILMKCPDTPDGAKADPPANDQICNAIEIADGGCYTQTDGNSNATSDYYGGCVPPNNPSLWFKTTLSAPYDYLKVDITCMAGRLMEVMLATGPCTNPVMVASYCEWSPFSFEFYDLIPGTEYYLMFSTQPGVGNEIPAFTMCFDQMVAPTFVTGPEQDCAGAIPVCDLVYVQPNSYDDYWDLDEIPNYQTCLLGGENNSVWYVFTPQMSGDLAFTINTTKDYDWAVYNLTAIGGCSAIPTATPVVCNYSDDYGNTGLSLPSNASVPRSNTATDPPIMQGIPVTAGTTYVLIVDNYTGDGTGYTLDFSASTASIADRPGASPPSGAYPTMISSVSSCASNTITINMSEQVQCITIRPSDYILTNTTTSTNFTSHILSVTGANCSLSELTTQLIITHDGTLTTGHYVVSLAPGIILADKCGNRIQGGTVSFDYLGDLTLTADPATICLGGNTTLDADGADGTGITYTISPGNLTNNTDGVFSGLSPYITTNYSVSATFGGCTKTANATVTVEGNIVTTISPGTTTVCSFTPAVTLTATTNINGAACSGCTYLWSTTQTGASISVAAEGTYTVVATTPAGCENMNNPSTTLTLASAGTGGSSCEVIYVSPGGGGTGLTKDSPTTLANAINMARCTYATIKMQKGIYTLNDYQPIHSYVTIEGGYDALFTTKSSNMTGAANSTTLRRSNASDSDAATSCTAFRVDANAENFRIQDIRIEMPGSATVAAHAAGSNKTNYGIKLGSACTNYNIVRCYIDAGVGSAP